MNPNKISLQDIIENEPALFEHDCDNCKYLGHYEGRDLYVCKGSFETTVIARFGEDNADYASGLIFATPTGNKWLYEARLRAEHFGLLTSEDIRKWGPRV